MIKALTPKIKFVLIIFLGLIVVLSLYDAQIENSLSLPIVVGHRGSGYGVENTIDTIVGAKKLGAEYAEMDILLSKDNVPMVTHDNKLKRLSGKNLKISEMTAEEIQQVEIKSGKETNHIPTLEDLAKASKGEIKLLLEFKTHGEEKVSLVDRVMEVLEKEGIKEDTIFHTAERSILKEFREKYPNSKIGYVFIGKIGRINNYNIKMMDSDFLTVEDSLIDKRMIKIAHKNKLPIYAWTINKDYKAETLLQMGVDGIITDYPDIMKVIRDDHIKNFK